MHTPYLLSYYSKLFSNSDLPTSPHINTVAYLQLTRLLFDVYMVTDRDGQYERLCLHFNNSPLVLPPSSNTCRCPVLFTNNYTIFFTYK